MRFGLVTRRELRRLGWDEVAIARARRRGEWVLVRRGVYAPAPLPEEPQERLLLDAAAAALTIGPGSAVSHEAAALGHGLTLLRPATEPAVTLPRSVRSPERAGAVRVHAAALPARHVAVRDGIPVTTAARTVVDVARWLGVRAGLVTADVAVRDGATTTAELAGVLVDCRGWPGLAAARRVVELADGTAESPLESLCRLAFRDAGLPPPTAQAWIRDGAFAARVDFLWPAYRTVVEADGLVKYDAAPALREEKLRQERLEELGYTVVRVSWTQLATAPTEVVARIRRAFRGLDRSPVRF